MTSPLEKVAMPTDAMGYTKVLAPAIAAALAGGAGYLTSSRGRGRPGETEEERRARILRNTLGMGAAGGVAGLTIPMAMSILGDAAPERDLFARLSAAVPASLRGVLGGIGGAAGGWLGKNPDKAHAKNLADIDGKVRDARVPWGTDKKGRPVSPDVGEAKLRADLIKNAPSMDSLRTNRLKHTGGWGAAGAGLGLALPFVGEAAGHPLIAPVLGAGVGGVVGSKIGPNFQGPRLQGPHGRAWGGGIGALLGSLLGSGVERADESLLKGNPINPFE